MAHVRSSLLNQPGPLYSHVSASALREDPEAQVGREVCKKFGDSYYLGEVTRFDGKWWRVKYTDGDEEDLSAGELRRVLVSSAGAEVRRQTQAQENATATATATAEASHGDAPGAGVATAPTPKKMTQSDIREYVPGASPRKKRKQSDIRSWVIHTTHPEAEAAAPAQAPADDRVCAVCFTADAPPVALGCGHVICATCEQSQSLVKCPCCTKVLNRNDTRRVYNVDYSRVQ